MALDQVELSELEPASIGSWPREVRIILLILASLVTFVMGYMMDLSDQVNALNNADRHLKELSNTYSDTQNKVANLDAYKKEVGVVEGQLETLTEQLPQTNEVAGLLEDVSQQAAQSGLRFISIKPLDQVNKGFYEEVAFELQMSGSYNGFGEFSSRIANMKRIVTFHDFDIARDTEGASESNFNDKGLMIKLIAKTYWVSSGNTGAG